jgi:hypothetical protein
MHASPQGDHVNGTCSRTAWRRSAMENLRASAREAGTCSIIDARSGYVL